MPRTELALVRGDVIFVKSGQNKPIATERALKPFGYAGDSGA